MTLPDSQPWYARPRARAWLAAAAVGLFIFALGAATDVGLGDESHHFRKASLFLEAGRRLTCDPAYGPVVPPGWPYYDGALWHAGLAILWWLTGTRSVLAAQAYQAAWVILLLGCAWEAGRALGGDLPAGPAPIRAGRVQTSDRQGRAGWWTMLAAAMPCVLFFGVLLYVEVAMMAFLALAAALAIRRHPLGSGLAFGLAFLVKPTVFLIWPAWFLGVLIAAGPGWRGRIMPGLLATLGTALVVVPDLAWRHVHLGTTGVVYLSLSGGDPSIPADVRAMLLARGPETFYAPSSFWFLSHRMTSLGVPTTFRDTTVRAVAWALDLATFLGVPAAVGLVLSLVRVRRLGRPVQALWLLAAVFLTAWFALMASDRVSEVRYLMPLFVVLILVAGLALADACAASKQWAAVLVALAAVQALTVGGFALQKRRIDPAFLAAVRAVGRLEVRRPPGFVLCPEAMVMMYGGRPILWAAVNPGPFFFVWSPEKQWRILDYFGVAYIVVPRARVYDDTEAKHTGGFPKSYVDRLPGLPYVEREPVIDRGGLVVYRVRPLETARPPLSPARPGT